MFRIFRLFRILKKKHLKRCAGITRGVALRYDVCPFQGHDKSEVYRQM
ncbi:MAG: hypothetical protein LBQ66_15775 [Planctomycetaceae bacterium]|jgi:hypothetical protein|nr:hypothetical protein [Planctomycetaceae bacterium]